MKYILDFAISFIKLAYKLYRDIICKLPTHTFANFFNLQAIIRNKDIRFKYVGKGLFKAYSNKHTRFFLQNFKP
jgi:hypothetical protein